jgi:hypothetical protein
MKNEENTMSFVSLLEYRIDINQSPRIPDRSASALESRTSRRTLRQGNRAILGIIFGVTFSVLEGT